MGPQLYIGANNQAYGPYEFAHVQAGVRRGEIQPQHMLSYDGRQWFPAQAIWPQLLGQAGFGPAPQTAQPQASAQRPVAHAQPIAQARQVLQAQAVATPASSIPPGVALAAETIDPEASVHSPWPARIVVVLIAAVFLFQTSALLALALRKLPGAAEFGPLNQYLKFVVESSIAFQFVRGAAIIAVSVWAYLAARDLALRNVAPAPPSPGWACAWFYVPLANFFMPAVMLQRLWKSSDWSTRGVRRAEKTMLIPIWWYGLVLCNLPGMLISGYGRYIGKERFLSAIFDKNAPAMDRAFVEVLRVFERASFGILIAETVVWGIGLALFLMFGSRVRTRVEMG